MLLNFGRIGSNGDQQAVRSFLSAETVNVAEKKKIFCNEITTEVSLWILPSDALLPNSGKDYHF